MAWISKTWTQEIDCQDLANQFPKSITFLFKTWHAKFWNVTLICKSIFPSLDNDCTIQDLAFQVLNPFGFINFSIRPKKDLCFSWLGFPRHEHKKMIVKTWQPNFWNLTLLFKTWHAKFWNVTFLQLHDSMVPILDNDCAIQDLAFQVLKPFGLPNFKIRPLPNLCLSWLGFPSK